MKRTVRFLISSLFVLCVFPNVTSQLRYTPEMDKYLGGWISYSRAGSVDDKMYLRIKQRGDYVSVNYKSIPAQRWVDEGVTTVGPHYTQIENLSFSNGRFKWHYKRSDDKGGYYEYYHSLTFKSGQLLHTENWYHNGKQMFDSIEDTYEPMDCDW